MKYSIFQIEGFKDSKRVKFTGYEETIEVSGKVDPEIYKKVWDGETHRTVPKKMTEFLEDLFYVFNSSDVRPPNYGGRSLSVSDVVVVDGVPYFCDSIGWRKIESEGFAC